MGEILKINNVHGYMDKQTGTAYLNADDVARGLGFTTVAKSGNEVVRWARVNNYFHEFGLSQHVGKDDFLPENMVYRLGFKASNEAAQKFQAVLADEVLPAIRRHGAYMTPEVIQKSLQDPDFMIQILQNLKQEQERNRALEADNERMRPKEIFADAVSVSKDGILVGALAKLIHQNGVEIGQKRLFQWLRDHGYLMKSGADKNMPTQKARDMDLFKVKERTINNPDGSVRLTRTTLVTGKGQQYFVNKFLAGREAHD